MPGLKQRSWTGSGGGVSFATGFVHLAVDLDGAREGLPKARRESERVGGAMERWRNGRYVWLPGSQPTQPYDGIAANVAAMSEGECRSVDAD